MTHYTHTEHKAIQNDLERNEDKLSTLTNDDIHTLREMQERGNVTER